MLNTNFATIPEPSTPIYPEAIRMIMPGDPASGGPGSPENMQAEGLVFRTQWLKERVRELAETMPGTDEFQAILDELRGLDVTELRELLNYLFGFQELVNRYSNDRYWIELFNSRHTLAEIFNVGVREAIAGSDCVDVLTSTEGIVPGNEYLISDSAGSEKIVVLSVLNNLRFRTEEPLLRTYDADAVITRTNWHFPDFTSGGGLAIAPPGGIYWSRPITTGILANNQFLYIGRSRTIGTLTLYYRDASMDDWKELEPVANIPLTATTWDVKYILPPISDPIRFKIVCSDAQVQVHHIVMHLSLVSTGDGDDGGDDVETTWGQIFGTITNQIDLVNFVNSRTNDAVPRGIISMWSGELANIPSGWGLCDGTNDTPNLLDRFICGIPNAETNPGTAGGAHSKAITLAQMPSHHHGQPAHQHGFAVDTHGAGYHAHTLPAGWRAAGAIYTWTRGEQHMGGVSIPGAGHHAHHVNGHTHSEGSQNTHATGGSAAFDVRPAFFTLAYIMKL